MRFYNYAASAFCALIALNSNLSSPVSALRMESEVINALKTSSADHEACPINDSTQEAAGFAQ